MAGHQIGFEYNDTDNIIDLHIIVKSRVEEYFEEYNLTTDSIVYIQVSFRRLSSKLLSEFSLNKPDHINIKENNEVKQNLNIPISINELSLGKSLLTR